MRAARQHCKTRRLCHQHCARREASGPNLETCHVLQHGLRRPLVACWCTIVGVCLVWCCVCALCILTFARLDLSPLGFGYSHCTNGLTMASWHSYGKRKRTGASKSLQPSSPHTELDIIHTRCSVTHYARVDARTRGASFICVLRFLAIPRAIHFGHTRAQFKAKNRRSDTSGQFCSDRPKTSDLVVSDQVLSEAIEPQD